MTDSSHVTPSSTTTTTTTLLSAASSTSSTLHMKEWVAGCFGGLSQILSGHPLDTIKVKIQTATCNLQRSLSPMSLLKEIIQTKGIRGLYRGAMSPLFGACILNSVEFGVYNECKQWFNKRHDTNEGPLPLYKIAIAGALAGVAGSVVTTPTEYLKCNLQVESNMNHVKFNGPFDLMRHLYKHQLAHSSNNSNSHSFIVKYLHQIRSYLQFYKSVNRGFAITTLRESGLALYFGSYEATIRLLQSIHTRRDNNNHSHPIKPPTWHSLIGGGIGGLVFWTVMFPIDLIKTRIQIDSIQSLNTTSSTRSYVSSWEMMKRIYLENGVFGFYSGYKSAILRAIIVNAAVFATYEQVKHFMDRGGH
ncbi:hypothetical protein C9374_004628 [Naegleria lovaniensis]|uniref:Mitochondrial carrier protein n=1 Tax=Naegleria lovaniensis TaxID=51637 RepID=A0AA88GQ84_NAELO|nr:uncharacterized protein C9374_004628 [Naegleria lovaniensis]KAG2383291.1 hypothetical protein C9374_004628 [Naegleria lovaniensis]